MAPTWSLAASVLGEVTWPEGPGTRWIELVRVSYAQFLEVQCHSRSRGNPHGKLRVGAYLIMKTPVLELDISDLNAKYPHDLTSCIQSKHACLSHAKVD